MSQAIDNIRTEFESRFAKVIVRPGEDGDKNLPYVYSGGECSHEDTAPALFSSPERAIESWIDVANDHVAPEATLEWVYLPELVSYQITMADPRQRHRLVNDRYCVKSQFVVHKAK